MLPEIGVRILGAETAIAVYPLFAALAALTALAISFVLFHKRDYRLWQTAVIYLAGAVFFLVGARLLNYVVNYENYINEGFGVFTPSFSHFSLYGGIALGAVGAGITVSALKKDFWLFADTVIFPFLAAFAVMRVGCFLNGCCYGLECSTWFSVPAPLSKLRAAEAVKSLLPSIIQTPDVGRVYPTQLMEMGFALIFIPFGAVLYKHKRRAGSGYLASAFIIYFSAFRLFVLYFRYLPYSRLVVSVIYPALYIACIAAGTVLLIWRIKRKRGEACS